MTSSDSAASGTAENSCCAPWYASRTGAPPASPPATGSIDCHQSITQSDFEKKR